MASQLISHSLQLYETELLWRASLQRLWKGIITTEFNFGDTSILPDGVVSTWTDQGHQRVVQVLELKNEIGEGGSDPIMQAECSYASIVCSDDVGILTSPLLTFYSQTMDSMPQSAKSHAAQHSWWGLPAHV